MKKHIDWGILKSSAAFAFAAIGTAWTALEIIGIVPFSESFLNWIKESSFAILVIVGIVCGIGKLICSVYRVFFHTYHSEDKTIRIRVGDILERRGGNIIVGVNEQLITAPAEIGPSSIHRQLTRTGGPRSDAEQIFREQRMKPAGERERFFQGDVEDKHIIFLPMSSLEGKQVVTTTLKMVSEKLADLFCNQGRLQVVNQTVFCPLLGTGEAGMHLSKEDTIKMIVRIFLQSCGKMTDDSVDKIKHLEIIVHSKDFREIDWTRLNQELDFMIRNCGSCVS